jgi:hypothetical protein
MNNRLEWYAARPEIYILANFDDVARNRRSRVLVFLRAQAANG